MSLLPLGWTPTPSYHTQPLDLHSRHLTTRYLLFPVRSTPWPPGSVSAGCTGPLLGYYPLGAPNVFPFPPGCSAPVAPAA